MAARTAAWVSGGTGSHPVAQVWQLRYILLAVALKRSKYD
jgi:hypothetical protein